MPGLEENGHPKQQAKHPIHVIQEILNNTPVDMIEHEYKQGSDGSIEIKIKIPGRAEQAKQRAMQQAEQAMQSGPMAGKATLDQVLETPSAPAGAGAEQGGSPDSGMAAAAAKNGVIVRVAMTPSDVSKVLRTRFPEKFLSGMGL